MPHEVIMPALGMAQDTGLIVAWLKAPGEPVAAGDALMEVETDKATMEVEAAHDGWLTDVRAREGEAVPVGQVVALISETEAGATSGTDTAGADPAPASDGGGDAPGGDTMPAGRDVIMPALGMAQDTGLIVAWLKEPGAAVAEGDALLEVETDKATMEVAADSSGWLAAVLAEAGEAVPVGQVIAVISAEQPDTPLVRGATAAPAPQAPAPAQPADTAGTAAEARPAPAAPARATPEKPAPSGGRVLASPLARRLAAERGLDLGLLAAAGIAQPYHAADLDRPELKPAAAPAAVATAEPLRLEAEIPAAGLDGFVAWLAAAEAGDPADLLPAFAAAALRAARADGSDGAGDPLLLRHDRPGAAARLCADPDRATAASAADDGARPALVLRDLSGSRISASRLGPSAAPVLSVARSGDTLRAALDFTADQIDTDAAVSLLAGFAERIEDPLRHLL